jgi:hypothetical protein
VNKELDRTRKEAVSPNLRHYRRICLEGEQRNSSQDSRFLERDLNTRPPEYEAGLLGIQPRLSIFVCSVQYANILLFPFSYGYAIANHFSFMYQSVFCAPVS